MYVREKHNRSGSTSVVVVSKASGKYKEIKSFGSSTSEEEIDSLCEQAATWIRSFGGQQELDFDDRKGKEVKGYITNTDLDAERVIAEYHGLWVVERAFRISKGTLEMRPMFHFTERRIEAHVCICFIAYKLYKELERLIAINKIGMSVDKVLDAAKTITTIRVRLPENNTTFTKTLFLTEKHLAIKPLFDLSTSKY